MLTIFSILLSYFFYRFDKTTHKIFFAISFAFLFCISISYDTRNSLFNEKEVFETGRPSFGFEFWAIYFESVLAFIIFYFILFKSKTDFIVTHKNNYHLNKLKKLYYYFSFISLAAFLINIIRVFLKLPITAILLNPRLYEKTFGASTPINYLYFLNIPALCLSVYLTQEGIQLKGKKWLNFLLIFISLFHGIKFTIFDTLLYPAIFLFLYKKTFSFKPVLVFSALLMTVYLGFNILVRGNIKGYTIFDQVLSYITPNFYNFFYSIEKTPEQFNFLSVLFIPDKLPNIFSFSNFNGISGFLMNEKYNMQTILSEFYNTFSIFAPFLFIPFLLLALLFYRFSNKNLVYKFVSVYLIFCLLFSFYFYAFTKTKYVYLIFVFVFIHYFAVDRNKTKKILDPVTE